MNGIYLYFENKHFSSWVLLGLSSNHLDLWEKKPLREKEKKLSNNNFSTQIVGSKIKIGHPKVSFYIPGSKRFYILNLSNNKDGKINVKG